MNPEPPKAANGQTQKTLFSTLGAYAGAVVRSSKRKRPACIRAANRLARHSAAKDREIEVWKQSAERHREEHAALREDRERLTREIQELKERLRNQ